MVAVIAGDAMWVAEIDDNGIRRTTDPYPAPDLLAAWAKASELRRSQYGDRAWTVHVKRHHPMLDMVRKSGTTGGQRMRQWVAIINDGDDNFEETDPFEARDDDQAWTKAISIVEGEYDDGSMVERVEPYVPEMVIGS